MEQTAPREHSDRNDAPPEAQNPSEYCPVCSVRLEPRSCKLVCGSCGYYMSCSDYY